jgi:hypothetical protein
VVHALHVESVAWIAERKDVLCGLFYLLAALLHVSWARAGGTCVTWRLQLAGVLALLSKPMAVTLPFALLLLDFWPLRRVARRRSRWRGCRHGLLTRPVLGVALEKLPLVVGVGARVHADHARAAGRDGAE